MRYYTKHHQFYCGIDLHARTMYICFMDHQGTILKHRNMPSTAQTLADLLQPYSEGLVLAVRVHLHPVLGGGSVQPHRRRVRSGPRPVHESNTRRQGEKRQDRLP